MRDKKSNASLLSRSSTVLQALLLATVACSCWSVGQAAEPTTGTSSSSSNPYVGGCLREKVPGWTKRRVCNSQDPDHLGRAIAATTTSSEDDEGDDEDGVICVEPPPLDYLEIRVASGNWDSNTALAWLVQIILSELLGVPSSNEGGALDQSRNFYDYDARIDYKKNARETFLEPAADLENGDCGQLLTSATTEETYVPCAHFIPEFWGANNKAPRELVDQGKIEPPQGIGLLGHESWFVTKFTAEEDPTLDSYHGLAGEKNRQKLAATFQRPTAWKDYCEQVSEDNCTTPDDTAQRYPSEEGEEPRMFVPDLYTGHFRYTEKNNCTMWPTNCTGHVANYPCGWSSRMESSVYHLNMALDPSNGPDGSPSGYSTSQLKEMWHAANATRSNLMMMWWTPEPLYQQYLGTDAEMQHVMLKPPSMACSEAVPYVDESCEANLTSRVGPPEAACGNPVEPLTKMIVGNLYKVLHSPKGGDTTASEATVNPAYNMLRRFQITEVQLGDIFDLWESEPTPRDGVCKWAADNLDFLMSVIPDSYPRITQEEERSVFGVAMMTLGSLATLVTLTTACAVYMNRKRPSIQAAQLDFLYILLSGSFLIGVGAILSSVPASDGSCTSYSWFIQIGYTLELVPLIIKVAAINRMMEAARRMRRVEIHRNSLYIGVASITVLVAVYLSVWTILDPSQRTAEYELTDSSTEVGERIVAVYYYCSSDSLTWEYVAAGWNLVLLLGATVLAFQTRNIIKTYNESRTLGVLIYSHFLFVILRCCTFLLSGHLNGITLGHIRTLLFSVDQIAACLIYFLPKLIAKEEPTSMRISGLNSSGSNPIQPALQPASGELFQPGNPWSTRNFNVEQTEVAPSKQPPQGASVTFETTSRGSKDGSGHGPAPKAETKGALDVPTENEAKETVNVSANIPEKAVMETVNEPADIPGEEAKEKVNIPEFTA